MRHNSIACHKRGRGKRAFTLPELLIVITIIAILSALGFSAFAGATQMAREQRTNSQIAKIDQLIMERYEGYRTRAVPVKILPGTKPLYAAQSRLFALRELMRMELPDRRTDIVDFSGSTPQLQPTATGIQIAAMQKSYFRTAVRALGGNPNNPASFTVLNKWSSTHEGAECLYLIMSTIRDGDKSALDYFSPDEIGDTDEDGMREILDGWGTAIEFLRWPAGYAEQPGPDGAWGIAGVDDDGNNIIDDPAEAGWSVPGQLPCDDIVPQTPQTRSYRKAPDPYDPVHADPRWGTLNITAANPFPYALTAPQPYALYPLIFSAGPDRQYDINGINGTINLIYSKTAQNATPPVPPNDPYYTGGAALSIVGGFGDINGDGTLSYSDNITNHAQRVK